MRETALDPGARATLRAACAGGPSIVSAVATHPSLASGIGIHLEPLDTEATVVALLLLVGINWTWPLSLEPAHPQAEPEE